VDNGTTELRERNKGTRTTHRRETEHDGLTATAATYGRRGDVVPNISEGTRGGDRITRMTTAVEEKTLVLVRSISHRGCARRPGSGEKHSRKHFNAAARNGIATAPVGGAAYSTIVCYPVDCRRFRVHRFTPTVLRNVNNR